LDREQDYRAHDLTHRDRFRWIFSKTLGLNRQCARKCNALALTAGELSGRAVFTHCF
jgi:hypothetical protein